MNTDFALYMLLKPSTIIKGGFAINRFYILSILFVNCKVHKSFRSAIIIVSFYDHKPHTRKINIGFTVSIKSIVKYLILRINDIRVICFSYSNSNILKDKYKIHASFKNLLEFRFGK